MKKIYEEFQRKLSELEKQKKAIISDYRKRLEEAKMAQLRATIANSSPK